MLLTPAQTWVQLTVMKDTGSLRRLRVFFSGSAHDSRCGQKHVIKAVESFLLQALRTLTLTIDEAVRFDNKIHDVRSKFDTRRVGRRNSGLLAPATGRRRRHMAEPCRKQAQFSPRSSIDGQVCLEPSAKGHSRSIHEVACPALCTRQSDSFQSRDSTNPPLSAHGSLGILQYASQHKAKPQRRRVAHSRLDDGRSQTWMKTWCRS